MDEPTAPLTPKEVETLFTIARRLRDEGRTIIFISHRLEEVRALCDRVTIFRDGNKIATEEIENLTDADIIRLMIGRPLREYMHKQGTTIGDVALKVEKLTLPGVFTDISFEVRKGEIVGLGGLVGAGRTDVARAIFGVAPAASGTVTINGNAVTITRSLAGHRARSRLRARGPRRGRHLPHALGRAEHHRRRSAADRAGRLHPPRGGKGAGLGLGRRSSVSASPRYASRSASCRAAISRRPSWRAGCSPTRAC